MDTENESTESRSSTDRMSTLPIPEWPIRDPLVRDALLESVQSGDWGRYHGRALGELEQLVAQAFAVEHCKTCSSGTIAVELALRGLRVTRDARVILAGYDFPGNFRAIEAVGGIPLLADLEQGSHRIDWRQLDGLTRADVAGILVSHLHGQLFPMRQLREWADDRDIWILEDACQVPGAIVSGRPAGSWGDAAVISFGGSKLLTAGRGGAVLTSRAAVFQRVKIASERGNDAYPLSELQAAVLIPQVEQLAKRNQTRSQRVAKLRSRLEKRGLANWLPLPEAPADLAAYYKVGLFVPDGKARRTRVVARAQELGLPIDVGFRGFALRSRKRCEAIGNLDGSLRAADSTILVHHPILLAEENVFEQFLDRLVLLLQESSD